MRFVPAGIFNVKWQIKFWQLSALVNSGTTRDISVKFWVCRYSLITNACLKFENNPLLSHIKVPQICLFFSENGSYIPTGLHIKLKDWEAHGGHHSPLFQHINLCVLCISYKLDLSDQNLWDCLCLLRIHVTCILSLTMTDE